MSDAAYLNEETGLYYVQGSYPLADNGRCSPSDTDSCLFAIDITTGEVQTSMLSNNFTVYEYVESGKTPGTALTWGYANEACNGYG